MSIELRVKLHSVAEDGLPDKDDESLIGRVAFIWDGAVVSGWHLHDDVWEPSEDRLGGPLDGVTHWLEFPAPFWSVNVTERVGRVVQRVMGGSINLNEGSAAEQFGQAAIEEYRRLTGG